MAIYTQSITLADAVRRGYAKPTVILPGTALTVTVRFDDGRDDHLQVNGPQLVYGVSVPEDGDATVYVGVRASVPARLWHAASMWADRWVPGVLHRLWHRAYDP